MSEPIPELHPGFGRLRRRHAASRRLGDTLRCIASGAARCLATPRSASGRRSEFRDRLSAKRRPGRPRPPLRPDILLPGRGVSQRCLQAFVWIFLALAGAWLLIDPAGIAWAQESTAAPTKTLFSYVRDGGFIGLIILLCSIVGVSLAITFAFQIRHDTLIPPELLEQVEGLFEDEEYEEAFHVCEATPSFLSAILMSALARIDEGYEKMLRAMTETGELETTKLHQKIGYLSVIASIAPMLGLFGTVYGMIITFNKIAISEVQPKPADLADGISTALVTTFLGLLVAIPMTVLFVIFKNRVVNVVLEVGGIAEELMERFKKG